MGQLIDQNTYEFDNGSRLERDPECKEIRLKDEYGNSDELRVWEEGGDNYEYNEWDGYFEETGEEKRQREYLAAGGHKCLHCKSRDIESGKTFWDDNIAVRVTCNDCNKSWLDCYKLESVVEE